MGVWLQGKPTADRIRESVKEEVARLREATGRAPGLAAVLVGDDKSSQSYVRSKEKSCRMLGLNGQVFHLPAGTTKDELWSRVEALNADEEIDAILVQLPLPKHLDANEVVGWIRSEKDVDGIHPTSLGRLIQNQAGLRPCTPLGVLELIRTTGTAVEGADVAVIGRSLIVGKPLAAMITNANGTVTICHSKSRDLAGICSRADILVAAMGKAAFVTREFIKPGAVVIDVGTSAVSDPDKVRTLFGDDPRRAEDLKTKGYTLVGDVDPRVIDAAGWLTPVPGGVGPLTIAMLMKNTLDAFKARRNIS